MSGNSRDQLLALFQGALKAVRGDRLVEVALCDSTVHHVIALGKAAEALAAGAWSAKRADIRSGFLALPRGYETGELPSSAPFVRHRGAHPLPDKSSLAAGAALERYASELRRGEAVTVLLSGGASACVESPAPGVDLALLRRVNVWLLDSGLPITAINAVRARLSRLKGGGLAHWLQGCEVNAWILSDVMGDSEWVGGAPLGVVPAEWPLLPDWLQSVLDSVVASPAVTVPLQQLAGNRDAVAAVCAKGGGQYRGELTGDLGAACEGIVRTIIEAKPGIFVWGGETTLELPVDSGRGGRCRHLALAVAQRLAGRANWCLLAAGTDGWDGADAVAGACVDGATPARGRCRGRDAETDLARADSGGFFAGSGEEVVTGPTGTNVNDLVIALKR